jgi:hypothetical protein
VAKSRRQSERINQHLIGKDKRIYPVESSSLTLQPTLYYKQLQIKPSAGSSMAPINALISNKQMQD